ncbi:hypothetical protein JQ604_05285 [Bradyrhizobium jicamae]|uniref:hypothetical protein n=1 Tax=Bradyrhizobium jicamae TaxID=280332 RepID=UPI001BA543DF|nr:hypothetical protein [Bradyrhizobium jicamae]MBR0751586.1 hypothetical protein [Bradyrhizobium jicamae]
MSRKRKKANKPKKTFAGSLVARPPTPQPEPRVCPWLVTSKTDTTAFSRLYGVARHYAGASDRWCEVQPGELQFHFSESDPARAFARFCLKKGLDISLRDKRKSGELEDLDALRGEIKQPRDAALMMKGFPEKRTFPMRLELAGNYADDAVDFLHRYRVTFYSQEVDYQGIKSRRAKAYVDLRMALEALLKAILCLRSPYSLAGKPLVDSIRRYSHDIDRLRKAAFRGVKLNEGQATAIAKCNIAPVDLRYQFDAMNFRVPNDQNYYDTIGSSAWLKTIEGFVQAGLKRLRAALGRRSKIVTGKVAIQELKRPSDYPSA